MNKRIFLISEDCFIIYTGQSSADNRSFLRIGNKEELLPEVQNHIHFIVIPDATKINFEMEKSNIEHMQKGRICYICNKENQDLLFTGLKETNVDTKKLDYQDLSKDLDNISKIENKKHFFTIFYDNQNVKLVFNEEIFFDLFNFDENRNYEDEENRLMKLINKLNKLHRVNKKTTILESLGEKQIHYDYDNSSLFIIQDNLYIPLTIGMFRIKETSLNDNFEIVFNCSYRFFVGKEASLTLLARGIKDFILNGFITEGEVIESEVLYEYRIIFTNQDSADFYKILSLYKHFVDEAKTL